MGIFGASGTDPLLESMGVLNTLGGSTKAGQQAIDFANQLYPQVAEADPWEAAFQFFAEMGRQASQPGATALGAGVSSLQVPMDYLNAKKKEKRETDRARIQTAVQIAPSLKPKPKTGSGTSVMVVGPDGKPRYMSSSEAIRTGAQPYIPPKSGQANDLKPFGLIDPDKLAEVRRVVPSASLDADGNILLTDIEAVMVGVRPYIGQKVAPDKSSGSTDFDQFTFTSPEAADRWLAANEGYTLTEDQKLGNASIILPKSMALVPANSSILTESLKPADPETVYKNFRTNYNTSPDLKKYEELKGHMDNVSTAYEQAYILEKPQVADLSMIFAYMKMLDPTSVVRESEQDQARRTGGAADWLVNYATMVGGGGSLTDEQRRSFRNGAHAFYENKTQGLTVLNKRFTAEATERALIDRFNLYKITPKEYDLKVFGEYPGDDDIDALTGSSGLTTLSIIAQYDNINANQLAKINQRIAQIKIDLGL